MAITATLSGTLTTADTGVTLITKTLSQIVADLTEGFHLKRFRVAASGSETVPLPAATGRLFALFLTGGPLTVSVGTVSENVAQNGFIIQQTAFTSLTLINSGSALIDVEFIVVGDDSA
jgi:hypothetical protein